jgi:hypothetical protein
MLTEQRKQKLKEGLKLAIGNVIGVLIVYGLFYAFRWIRKVYF